MTTRTPRTELQGAIHDLAQAELNTGPVRWLVREGCWCIPPAERSKGWEAMGVRPAQGVKELNDT